MSATRKVVVGISGASGAVYGVRLLKALKELGVETHLVATETGREVMERETGLSIGEVAALATFSYDNTDMWAPISSGSFRIDSMVIAPCSMKTLAGIAHGYSQNLLLRAADVTLKEKRPLILVPRETPLSTVHLENMLALARIGVLILPAMPGFYNKPKTIEDLVDFVVSRILDRLGLEKATSPRWNGKG